MSKTFVIGVVAVLAAMAVCTVRASELTVTLDEAFDVGAARRVGSSQVQRFSTAGDETAVDANGHALHDATVSYEVEVFGSLLTLDLVKNEGLFAPGYVERTLDDNQGIVIETYGRENCYYIGTVRDYEGSVVALSTCEGLSGFIHTGPDSGLIHTEPAHLHMAEHADSDPSRRRDTDEVMQIFYTDEARRNTEAAEGSACGLDSAVDRSLLKSVRSAALDSFGSCLTYNDKYA